MGIGRIESSCSCWFAVSPPPPPPPPHTHTHPLPPIPTPMASVLVVFFIYRQTFCSASQFCRPSNLTLQTSLSALQVRERHTEKRGGGVELKEEWWRQKATEGAWGEEWGGGGGDRQTDRQRDWETETERRRETETNRQTTERDRGRQTKQTDKPTATQRERETDTERQRERVWEDTEANGREGERLKETEGDWGKGLAGRNGGGQQR